MKVNEKTLLEAIGISIPGDFVMGCDPRVWQTYLFSTFVHRKRQRFREKTMPFTVDYVQRKLKETFRGDLCYDLVCLKDVPGYETRPDLTQVIHSYLVILDQMNFLIQRPANSLYKAPFIPIDRERMDPMELIPPYFKEFDAIEGLVRRSEWDVLKETQRIFAGSDPAPCQLASKATDPLY